MWARNGLPVGFVPSCRRSNPVKDSMRQRLIGWRGLILDPPESLRLQLQHPGVLHCPSCAGGAAPTGLDATTVAAVALLDGPQPTQPGSHQPLPDALGWWPLAPLQAPF